MRKTLGVLSLLTALAAANIVAVEWSRPKADPPGTGWLREFNDPAERPVLLPREDPGIRIPTDFEDALEELERILDPAVRDEIRFLDVDDAGRLHLGLGMWLRHNWKLWDWGDGEESQLRNWFTERDVNNADLMSALLLHNLVLKLQGRPLVIEEQLATIRKANREPEVALPRTGTIGPTVRKLGRRLDERVLRFTATAEGALTERRRELPGRELLEYVFVMSETAQNLEHPEQPSEIFILIRAHRAASWSVIRRLLEACADPAVRVYKVIFAVESETDGEPGTLAAFQPIAFAPPDDHRYQSRELPGQMRLCLSRLNGKPPSLDGLFAALRESDPAWKSVPAVIRPGDEVATETVLRAFDLLLRAGARWVFFGPAPEEGSRQGVSLNGVRVAASTTPDELSPVSRSTEMAGVCEPPPLDSVERDE
jgi:Domain of unknown function (DUF6794)